MIILCAGVQRSGSTLLYNIARLAFPNCNAAWINDWQRAKGTVNVVKLHHCALGLQSGLGKGDFVLTTRRDPRDVAASCIPRWVPEERIVSPYLEGWVKRHRWWNARTDLEIEYAEFVRDLPGVVTRILQLLGSTESPDAVMDGLRALEEPKEPGYDPTNLLHKGHKQDGRVGYFREKLSPELVSRIETHFAGWFRDFGYEI
jgi:hypothetical protein